MRGHLQGCTHDPKPRDDDRISGSSAMGLAGVLNRENRAGAAFPAKRDGVFGGRRRRLDLALAGPGRAWLFAPGQLVCLAAGDRWPVWLPFSLFFRAAPGTCGGGRVDRLSVALADRAVFGASAGGAAVSPTYSGCDLVAGRGRFDPDGQWRRVSGAVSARLWDGGIMCADLVGLFGAEPSQWGCADRDCDVFLPGQCRSVDAGTSDV